MKHATLLLLLVVLFNISRAQKNKVLLPNGWTLTPAGETVALGSDLPLNIAVSRDGKYLAITNNGVGEQSIQLIDAQKHVVLNTKIVTSSWLGLKFSNDNKNLYASGGNDNKILKFWITHDTLALVDSYLLGKRWPEKISPAGIDIDERNNKMYVVTKENNSLYIIDMNTKEVIKQVQLSAPAYTCILPTGGNKVYISLWGGRKLVAYDIKKGYLCDSVNIGQNPNDICVSKNGKYLYVANAVDNSVSVIDTKTFIEIETLNAALYPDAPNGSTTNSVSLSEDNNTLYIANADNNCLAVFDVSTPSKSFSKGFIPVGWYPTCVRVLGRQIFVSNGKGNTSLPNPEGPQPVKKEDAAIYKKANKKSSQYIGGLFKGTLNAIPVPDDKAMKSYTRQVYANTPYTKEKETLTAGEKNNPIPMKVGDASPIKHVFYIMKENRTYDQVLGDMERGNGDTSLVLFGRNVTPNQHALAEQFVLLDNFYVDAEVSADGHNWRMAAYANDYVEKNWPTNYGGRGGNYDFAANKPVAEPRNGFLWDYALRKGLTFRDYGEFTDDDGTVYLPDLKKHMCPSYPGWNLNIRDMEREKIWEHDFDSLAAKNDVPQLNIIYLPSDHTAGLGKKSRTPEAFVADNDLAVGTIIEHLSNSAVWQDCAVFILEDDAQNGPDHVDAHRSTAYLAGPYVKRKYVDHTPYSTAGMLRTIEMILGLPPMSQYDAAATTLYKSFTMNADTTRFTHETEMMNMDALNTASTELSRESESLDFSSADRVPDAQLNQLLWKAVRGNAPYPAPRRAAFVAVHEAKDKDDD